MGAGWGGHRNILHTATAARLAAADRAGFSHGSLTFLSMLGVRCQPGPWLLASSQRVGKCKGLPGLSWSLSDPDIKHDDVLAMHFVLLSCEPRVYKPTGRMVSSSSWALPVLLLAAGTSLVHAPELQMGLCCHFLLAYERKKKRNEKSSRSLLFAYFFRT